MSDINPELLKRYAHGHCNPEETAKVEQWLNQDEDVVESQLFAGINKNDLKQELWNEVKPTVKSEKTRIYFPAYLYKVAICLIIAGFAGYYAFKQPQLFSKGQPTAVLPNYREMHVAKGRKAQLTLTDGTVIYLNSESKLKYPVEFTGETRVVYLSGEAHFKVAKDRTKPFIIHTAQTDTRVLGTVFNIKAYPDENRTTLTVEEGRVQFSLANDKAKNLILTAGLQGIAENNQVLRLQTVYAANFTAWKSEKLVFNNLPLKEIVPLLSRWYNVEVVIGDHKLEKERFTGTYHQAPIDTIAQDISQAFHCQFKLNGPLLLFY